MENLVCDFSVGFDNEIEEIVMYDDVNFTEEKMTEVVEKMVKDRRICVGERCEGSIYCDMGIYGVEYKWCSEIGEDWGSDEWNNEKFEINILQV